jgi:hypothetical protein
MKTMSAREAENAFSLMIAVDVGPVHVSRMGS